LVGVALPARLHAVQPEDLAAVVGQHPSQLGRVATGQQGVAVFLESGFLRNPLSSV